MARPSKLTPAVQATVVEAIRAGHYQEQAARLSVSVLFELSHRADSDGQPCTNICS